MSGKAIRETVGFMAACRVVRHSAHGLRIARALGVPHWSGQHRRVLCRGQRSDQRIERPRGVALCGFC